MKTSKLFWGFILVTLGVLSLLENLGYINFELRQVWRMWPIILIYSGVDILFGKDPRAKIPILAISVLLFVLFIYYVVYTPSVSKSKDETSWNYNSDDDDDANDNSSSAVKTYDFTEPFDTTIKIANLDLQFGAGNLKLSEPTNNLLSANVKSSMSGYEFTTEKNGDVADINFYSKSNKKKYNYSFKNDLDLSLNTAPIWNINADFGAAKTYLDLSKFKVSSLKANFGAATLKVKLSDLQDLCNVAIDMGAAKLVIQIPKTVGCQIVSDAQIASTHFDGFKKSGEDTWQTDMFSTSKKKIMINIDGGVSKINIERY